jgi:hypothetical protein
MPLVDTVPAALPAQSRSLATPSVETVSIPWTIWFMAAGIISGLVGGNWDFAWHRSIGRETFWTAPHILVQMAAVLVGFASAYAIVAATIAGPSRASDASVKILGVRAPAGAFIALWGSLAMVASAPFDNWWHNAYGLDVQFITPPHGMLSLGYFATQIGAMVWVSGMIHRANGIVRERLMWLLLIQGGICVVLLSVMIMPLTTRGSMHSASCYLAVAMCIPAMLIAAGRGAGHKWGCTIVAAVYMGIGIASEWLLPLVPAQPRLGPVYHNVTHLMPLQFPLLLIVPAVVADLLLQRLERRSSWIKAAWVGPALVLAFAAVQWPFANFLMSPASRNWIFGTHYVAYFDPAGILYNPYQFRAAETTPAFVLTMVAALVVSTLMVRLGLGWGDWMRRVRR